MKACKYCEKREAIKNSHIIPAFIYKWLKDTSPTGFIRATNEPNKRKQDGSKSSLLCKICEKQFSKVETCFKKDFFSKLANYQKPAPKVLSITESVRKCIYVIAWRVLADTYYFPKENEYTDEEFIKFPDFLKEIKNCIESGSNGNFRTHLIPCTKGVLTKLNLPQVPWIYYDRSICAEPRIWDNWNRFVIFIKIPSAIICFEIVPNKDDTWEGTQIDNTKSMNLSDVSLAPNYVSEQIIYYFDFFMKSRDEISDKQQQRMMEYMKKANNNCGYFKSMSKRW